MSLELLAHTYGGSRVFAKTISNEKLSYTGQKVRVQKVFLDQTGGELVIFYKLSVGILTM